MNDMKPMRLAFGEMLCELGEKSEDLVVLDADVSSSTQTKWFGQKYPERFFNFGIAEANMVSAAAGMAASGLIPVVSSFAFLLTLRTGDPIRSLIAYNKLNVKIAGGYAGLSDFADGASHQSVMDLAIMRAMPNMTVLTPSDIETTRSAVKAMIEMEGPCYVRLSRSEVGSYHGGSEKFEIGKANVLREGKDAVVVVSGAVLGNVLEAYDRLSEDGIKIMVLEYPTIKPFDSETLGKYSKGHKKIFTVEEHSIIGGLGSAVCEAAEENDIEAKVIRIGINDCFGESGKYDELLDKYGLSVNAIYEKIKQSI